MHPLYLSLPRLLSAPVPQNYSDQPGRRALNLLLSIKRAWIALKLRGSCSLKTQNCPRATMHSGLLSVTSALQEWVAGFLSSARWISICIIVERVKCLERSLFSSNPDGYRWGFKAFSDLKTPLVLWYDVTLLVCSVIHWNNEDKLTKGCYNKTQQMFSGFPQKKVGKYRFQKEQNPESAKIRLKIPISTYLSQTRGVSLWYFQNLRFSRLREAHACICHLQTGRLQFSVNSSSK